MINSLHEYITIDTDKCNDLSNCGVFAVCMNKM